MSAATVLREYGESIRGDWSDVDGRTVRATLDQIAGWVEQPDTFPSIENARREIGVCVTGGGHWCGPWYGYCNNLYDCGCPDDPNPGQRVGATQ